MLFFLENNFKQKCFFSQLFYDGHQQLALNLATSIGVSSQPPPPSDKLFRLVSIAKQFIDDPDAKDKETALQVYF